MIPELLDVGGVARASIIIIKVIQVNGVLKAQLDQLAIIPIG